MLASREENEGVYVLGMAAAIGSRAWAREQAYTCQLGTED